MRIPSDASRQLALAAAAAAFASLTCTACSSGHPERTPPTVPTPTAPAAKPPPTTPPTGRSPRLPSLKDIDGNDPTAVSRAALTAMWSVDSAIDRGQDDVYRRARPYLTSGYYAVLTGRTARSPWSQDWWDHRAYTQVTLTPSKPLGDVQPDTPYTAHREWKLTVAPIGRDGWHGPALRLIAFVVLEKPAPGYPWKVSHVGTGTDDPP